jgi:hypothetical protein
MEINVNIKKMQYKQICRSEIQPCTAAFLLLCTCICAVLTTNMFLRALERAAQKRVRYLNIQDALQ